MGLCHGILFYGRWFLGEGLSFGKAWNTMFILLGGISWVGKQAQLNANALSLQEGWWLIAQAITEWHVKARGPGCPCLYPPVLPPFQFHNHDGPPSQERPLSADKWVDKFGPTCQTSVHDWWQAPQCGWDCSQMWCDAIPITFTFTESWVQEWQQFNVNFLIRVIMFWQITRLQACTLWPMPQGAGGPYENQSASLQGWGEKGCHHLSKLALGFDGVSLCWVLRLHPSPLHYLLPTSCPGELVRSSGTDVTLDDTLTILDEHYNNVKALDALNQELFQVQMDKKETFSDWGVHLNWNEAPSVGGCLSGFKWWWHNSRQAVMRRHIQIISKWHGRLRRKKPWSQPATRPWPVQASQRQWASSFYRNIKAISQLSPLLPGWHTWRKRVPNRRNVLKAKTKWHWGHNWRIHCAPIPEQWKMLSRKTSAVTTVAAWTASSTIAHWWQHLEHSHLNWKEGMVPKMGAQEGSPSPSRKGDHTKGAQRWDTQGIKCWTQTPFLNHDPFNWWYGMDNVVRIRVNGESCMALLDNGAQINTITPGFIEDHSLDVGPLLDVIGKLVACVVLVNALAWPVGYVIIWVQVGGGQGYDKDQIALVIPGVSNSGPHDPGNPYDRPCHEFDKKEGNRCSGNTLGQHLGSLPFGSLTSHSNIGRWQSHYQGTFWIWSSRHHQW